MSQLLLSSLGVVCPSCDGFNPPGAAQCTLCGASLVEGQPARPAPPAPSPAPWAAAPQPREQAAKSPAPRAAAAAGGASKARPGDAVPPGMKPTQRPPAPPAIAPPAAAPRAAVPAASRPAAQGSKFGITVLSGPAQGQRFRLPLAGCVVGRTKGSILFDDPTVSPQHATFVVKDDRLFIRDEGSVSGVFATISAREQVAANALFAAGSRLFRFTGPHYAPAVSPGRPTVYGAPVPQGQPMYMVEEILVGGRPGRAIVSYGPLMTVGQAHCDFSFPQDLELAGRHVEVTPNPGGASLQDLSGGLGTYVRLPPQTERPLQPGDRVRIGQQVVRIEGLA